MNVSNAPADIHSQLCCVGTHRQPLAGERLCKRMQSQARLNYGERSQPKRLCLKDSVADTKTLAESERRQLHPLPLW